MPELCPACKKGIIEVVVQVMATITDPDGPVVAQDPNSDDFVSAQCTFGGCGYSLLQQPGDGRLRRAELWLHQDLYMDNRLNDERHDDPVLETAYTAAVTRILKEG